MRSRRDIDNPPQIVQAELVREFFLSQEYPVSCAEATDAILSAYEQRTGRAHFYVGSIIRRLHKQGFLIRVSRGTYAVNPSFAITPTAKRRFIRLYYAAKRADDEQLIQLYRQILRTYDENGICLQIRWRE